jgi:adenosylhomocysteine nucleosidase
MKKIGLIFAMKEEMDEFIKLIDITREITFYDITFIEGKLNNNICYLVESGVGKVNASRVTQLLIDKMNPDYIINAGVAGSVSESVLLKDIVVGTKMVCHDFDITAFNHEKGYIPGIGVYIDNNKELISICKNIKGSDVHFGVIASADKFVTDKKESMEINKTFNALCVEMEGCSISQVCFLCAKPCLVIRSISDSIYKGNNKETYEDLLSESSKKVCEFVEKIIRRLK